LNLASIVRVGTYDDPLAALIKTLKFNRRHEVAGILGVYLHQALSMHTRDGKQPRVDAVVPIPLHWRRHWMRGFNQAEEISRIACKLGHWPMFKPLWRIRATMPQSVAASRAARAERMAGVFWCPRTHSLAGKHIWLVDDVCTTGATLRSAATAIRKLPKKLQPAGIHAAVLAITDHRAVGILSEPV
jgi:ComF family protein